MGAAQNQRVDVVREQRLEVASRDLRGHRIVEPTLFDERHEQRAGLRPDFEPGDDPAQRDGVGIRAHRRFRGDDADAAVAGRGRGAIGARFDHPPDRQRGLAVIAAITAIVALLALERQCGGGVAGDHDRLDAAALEKLEIDLRVPPHRGRGLRAVRQPGGVAEIEQALARQAPPQRGGDGQPADTRVENSDRPRVAQEASRSARSRRGRPVSTCPASEGRCTPFHSSTTRFASSTLRSTELTTA